MPPKTIPEFAEALDMADDQAAVRGLVRYLERCGVLCQGTMRPTPSGRGRGATEYDLAPDVYTGLNVAVERLAKALDGMRDVPVEDASIGSVTYPMLRWKPKSLVVMTGRPGSGKTSFAMSWLSGFDGPVAIMTDSNVFCRKGTGQDILLLEKNTSLHNARQMIDRCGCRAVLFDEMSESLDPGDLRDMLLLCRGLEVLFAVPHGGLEHPFVAEADEHIYTNRMSWSLHKSHSSSVGICGEVLAYAP